MDAYPNSLLQAILPATFAVRAKKFPARDSQGIAAQTFESRGVSSAFARYNSAVLQKFPALFPAGREYACPRLIFSRPCR
jgi:hypothetical protein